MQANPILEKNRVAGTGGTTKFQVVKRGSADNEVVAATASTEVYVGVAQETVAAGSRVRVMLLGITECIYGGNVTEGARLTAGAAGVVVAAAPGAGTNASIVGIAMKSGASGDIGEMLLSLGNTMQG